MCCSSHDPKKKAGSLTETGLFELIDIFLSKTLHSFTYDQVRELFVFPSAESAGELQVHAAGNDIADCVTDAAALPWDTDLLHIAADSEAAGRLPEQSRVPTCSILYDSDPIHGPSAHPSGATHSTATLERTQEVVDRSSQGLAG